MIIKVVTEIKDEEIKTLEEARQIISDIITCLGDNEIEYFGGYKPYELQEISDDIETIIDEFKSRRKYE